MTGRDLRVRRKALGLTQAALAEALGVSANTIACWERGEKRMDHERMVDMAVGMIEAREAEVAALFAAGDADRWAADAATEARRTGAGELAERAAVEAQRAAREARAAYSRTFAAAWTGDAPEAKRALAETRRAVRKAEAATMIAADAAEEAERVRIEAQEPADPEE